MEKGRVKRTMRPGDRAFVKRTSVVLLECFDNKTNNVNDTRDRVYHEVTLVENEVEVVESKVPDALKEVLA